MLVALTFLFFFLENQYKLTSFYFGSSFHCTVSNYSLTVNNTLGKVPTCNHGRPHKFFQGGKVDMLLIFFRLLIIQCNQTFTKRFILSAPVAQPEWGRKWGVTRGQGEHNSAGAESLRVRWMTAGGSEKSEQCHKYFFQYSMPTLLPGSNIRASNLLLVPGAI